jgi:ankyrin repeat protein
MIGFKRDTCAFRDIFEGRNAVMRAREFGRFFTVLTLSAATLGAAPHDGRLIEAIKKGDLDAVRALVSQGIDVNGRAGDGATALHWAVYNENQEAIELLLRAHATVNAANELGVTPLWVASSNGSSAIVARLVQAGANPDLAPATGGTPLMVVSRRGDVASAKLLLSYGADVNANEDANGQTALMWAVAEHHQEIVAVLLEAGADVHARSKSSRRVVLLCCPAWAGDSEGTVELDQGGLTPLLFSALNGDVASATRLLAAGANVNDIAAGGATALVMAAHRGHGALVRLLLERGADPNAAGAGYTALHSAVLRSDQEMVKTLLAHRANLNPRLTKGTYLKRGSRELAFDKFLIGATPFMLAARLGNLTLLRTLAAAGADLSLGLEDGRPPLIVAAQGETTGAGARARGSEVEPRVLEAVKLLIELGADVDAVDRAGNTAVHVAAARKPGFDTVVQSLADRGARVDVANHNGATPLALALAPPPSLKGQATFEQTLKWRADYAAWVENKGRTSTVDLLRKLGAKE